MFGSKSSLLEDWIWKKDGCQATKLLLMIHSRYYIYQPFN